MFPFKITAVVWPGTVLWTADLAKTPAELAERLTLGCNHVTELSKTLSSLESFC